MSQRLKGFIAVMISAVFFGLVPLLVQSVNAGGSNTLNTAFYRFFLSVPLLYLYLRVKKVPLGLTRVQVRDVLLITICGYGGTALLLFTAYNYIPTGMATTVHFTYPVFVILGSILFLKEKVRPLKILCVGLCFAGILLFYGGGEGNVHPLGILLAFLSGITYSFYIIYLERSSLAGLPSLKLIFYMHAVASVLLLAICAGTGRFTVHLTAYAWIMAVILAVGIAFVAVYCFQRGVQLIGAQNASILSTLEPITSLVVGVIAYQESFGLSGILGCVLILASVVIVAKMEE